MGEQQTSWVVEDVRARLRLGEERGRGLWTAEEVAHLDAWHALEGEPAVAAARATTWTVTGWPASRWSSDVTEALVAAGIVCRVTSPPLRRAWSRRAALVAAAQRAGLSVAGGVDALRRRLDQADVDVDGEFLSLARPRLMRDVARWATMSPWPDPAAEVLERMERVRWPSYVPEGGPPVPERALWDAWADRMDDPASGSWDETLALLATSWRPPGRLDVTASIVRAWRDTFSEEAGFNAPRLRALAEVAAAHGAEAWLQALEAYARAGAWQEAAASVEVARRTLRPIDHPAIERWASRWVSKGLARPAPRPPRRAAPCRDLGVPSTSASGRRRWEGPTGASAIERAVVHRLAAQGRLAFAGEGALWRSLVALLLASVSFDVACGQLPVPRLSGPLDGWTPAYAERRASSLAALREEVLAGRADAHVAAAVRRFEGCRLSGVRWRLLPLDAWSGLARALPPDALWGMVEGFLWEGRGFAVGLPDLVVLPGPAVRLSDAFPSLVPEGLVLAEIKGPTDALRDAQSVRHDQLLRMGLAVEVWYVHPRSGHSEPLGGGS